MTAAAAAQPTPARRQHSATKASCRWRCARSRSLSLLLAFFPRSAAAHGPSAQPVHEASLARCNAAAAAALLGFALGARSPIEPSPSPSPTSSIARPLNAGLRLLLGCCAATAPRLLLHCTWSFDTI